MLISSPQECFHQRIFAYTNRLSCDINVNTILKSFSWSHHYSLNAVLVFVVESSGKKNKQQLVFGKTTKFDAYENNETTV